MAESDRHFLGLTHNPFVEPQKGFFEQGGRKQHLEQLRHLTEWSRRVLLVTGPAGSGKTILYRELAATLEPRVKAARINATLVNTGREVLSAIAQGFGLAAPPDASTQVLRTTLLEHVEEQMGKGRSCMALVDDAHLLDNKSVAELMTLAHDSTVHLVLFGEPGMGPVIEQVASSKGVGWQEIQLAGYGDADARDYLEWRFRQARYRGRIPFTDQQVKDLVRKSEGLPGRINMLAHELLEKLESGEPDGERRGFPRFHAGMLALLATVVVLLYVLVADDPAVEEEPVPEPQTERLAAAGGQADAAPAVAGSDTDTVTDTDTETPASVGQQVAQVEPVAAGEAEEAPEGSVAASEPLQDTAPVAGSLTTSDASGGAERAQSTVGVTTGEADPSVAVSPAPEPSPAQEVAQQRQPAPAQEAATPSPQTPSVASGIPRDVVWLLDQNPAAFTLQLVTLSSRERAEAFVARQIQPDQFVIYSLERDGRALHVVLYGLFPDRAAAQAVADNLPTALGDIQPWIRQHGPIQDAARISRFQ
jgi:DamX protein